MNRKILFLVALALSVSVIPAFAEVERLQPDFTFRRVSVPTAGTVGRINVQIDPNAARLGPVYSEEPEPEDVAAAIIAPQSAGTDWFWNEVSFGINNASPARLERALHQINNPPAGEGVTAPRLQSLQDIANA